MVRPCCLTIAGSDSGGNAGVQADLRTFHAYHLHGCTAFTALTAQHPEAVTAIHPLPIDFIRAQLEAVLDGYHICALKTGMLHSPQAIETIAATLQATPKIAKVIDPVMVATSGARLISHDAIAVLKRDLFPLATLITPNRIEAEILAGCAITNETEAKDAARALYDTYGASVILKGGHFDGDLAIDLLYDGETFTPAITPRIPNPISTHGTGCTFAAALTAELALGRTLVEAFRGAKKHVHTVIERAYLVGPTYGVLGFNDEYAKVRRYLPIQ